MPQTLVGCWTCGHTQGCFHNLYGLGGTLAQRQLPCEPDTVGDNVQLDPDRLVWRLRVETESSHYTLLFIRLNGAFNLTLK